MYGQLMSCKVMSYFVQEICKVTAKKEVTPFDMREMRLEGTDAEHFKVD